MRMTIIKKTNMGRPSSLSFLSNTAISQAHPQSCNRLLEGLVLPLCLPSLETPPNLALDPASLLPVDPLSPTSSPSPFFPISVPNPKNTSYPGSEVATPKR